MNECISPLTCTYLINLLINEIIFSDDLKIAKVIPICNYDHEQSINTLCYGIFQKHFKKLLLTTRLII